MTMRIHMKEGAGLEICRHHGAWYIGVSRPEGKKGIRYRYHKEPSFDEAVNRAARFTRAWRGRGWKLQNERMEA